MADIKWNERAWSGQIISWIKSAIENRTTVFQDATNDSSLKVECGRTKFPDILLFTDKTSGIVFNGWELKFPDTPVDDTEMLANALEKARRLRSDSFVTWNGAEAVIWGVDKEHYSIETLTRIKEYPKADGIDSRDDLADYNRYLKFEPMLRARLNDILHDLEQLMDGGHLRPALNISGNVIECVRKASQIIIPQFREAIVAAKSDNPTFKDAYNEWRTYESATMKILERSSRRAETVDADEVLAKFTFYTLTGKILFYLTLCENYSGELDRPECQGTDMKTCLNSYFDKAKAIDFQAIFKPDFTDCLEYSPIVNDALAELLKRLTEFDFRILPPDVTGNILENLVPRDEKQKFGQYFTPEILANLVAYPAVRTRGSVLMDPTSGTGTFFSAFYRILKYDKHQTSHSTLLEQIWGNDISHFPAILSVINLYRQDVTQTDNFPRVLRDNFFNLAPGNKVLLPDSRDHTAQREVEIPMFDGIASNFPFIQQEDIPNNKLTDFFRYTFQREQRSFLQDEKFYINERSDYFTYCIYHSFRFLKDNGILSCITSNAWLGKAYGEQFKMFLLDNFHIKYIVRSNAEHWFSDSAVSTVFFVLEKKSKEADRQRPTRFVTLNKKLDSLFGQSDPTEHFKAIDDFYRQIEQCDNPRNLDWKKDSTFSDLYKSKDGNYNVCIIPETRLREAIAAKESWASFFLSAHIFEYFDRSLTIYHPAIVRVIRGERTGWNPMFILSRKNIPTSGIAAQYLQPYLKNMGKTDRVVFDGSGNHKVFVCDKPLEDLDAGTASWIKKFENEWNKNKSATIPQACAHHRPYWYSINPKKVDIITAINPYERFFFSYSKDSFAIDQRLIGLQVQEGYDTELIAALLNSAVTFLSLELRGTPRNLGVLDLNADYLKRLRILNPDLLDEQARRNVVDAFRPLKNRAVLDIKQEVRQPDRRKFDEAVFRAFGFDPALLATIYELLTTAVEERVSMCGK